MKSVLRSSASYYQPGVAPCTLDMRDGSRARLEVFIRASTRWFGFMNRLGLFEFDGFGVTRGAG